MPTAFDTALRSVQEGQTPEVAAETLLSQLTKDEQLHLLDGDTPFWPGFHEMLTEGYNRRPYVHGELTQHGIPGFRFTDGPRGIVMGGATAFPVSMARGATWDVALEEAVGVAVGREARAMGANFFGGVCVNLPRHPAWGRAQETYSEDPVLLGEFGAALTRGVQKNAMATVKHFALNSMENARFKVDVRIEEDVLQEVYLPHFRRCVEEGVGAVMSAYNSLQGEWAGQNEHLLHEILRDQWGYKGVVVSDFIWGLRDAALSLKAGLDIEEPFAQQRVHQLKAALENGDVATWKHVERAGIRILATQLRHYAERDAEEPEKSVVSSAEHQKLAREVAARSMVLLQNEKVDGQNILPLDSDLLKHVAVIGRLANIENTGDHGSSWVKDCPHVVTAYEGIKSALPNAKVVLEEQDDINAAKKAASGADVAVVVVGYTAADEGEFIDASVLTDPILLGTYPPAETPEDKKASEAVLSMSSKSDTSILGTGDDMKMGGDRSSLRVRPFDAELIAAVSEVCPKTIVCVVTAGAVIMEEWRSKVPGLLISWYSGAQGGNALADVLLGKVDASGRLPYSIPTTEEHLPYFDMNATSIVYDRWHGQRLLDHKGWKAAFPMGFGLSYTQFQFSDLHAQASKKSEEIDVKVTVKNTGSRDGRQIVQVYGKPLNAGDDFPARLLLGFAPVDLSAGESKVVHVAASTRSLKRWRKEGGFAFASEEVELEVAGYAGDDQAVMTRLNCKNLS